MRYITRTQLIEYQNTIVDEETGMTYADYLEWLSPYEDWTIIEDKNIVWGNDNPNEFDKIYNQMLIDEKLKKVNDAIVDLQSISPCCQKCKLYHKDFGCFFAINCDKLFNQ